MMENKTQRKRGKNKNQNDSAFYHHTQMESNNNSSNHLYPVSSDNSNYSSPPRSARNRYNSNARNQMNYTQTHAHPNDNNPNNMHINAPNQNHANQNNHNHRPYNNRDNPPYHSSHRYYRTNRNDAHARYPSNAAHNQSKYQYNAQKARNSQYSHYHNQHVYNHRNTNNPHSQNNHSHSHTSHPQHTHAPHANNNAANNNNIGNNNHNTQQHARYANNSARKHQDEYGPPHSGAQHINHNINHHPHIHTPHNQHMPPHNHPHNKPQHHHAHGPRSATPHNQHLNHTHTPHNTHTHNQHGHNTHAAHVQHLHIMPAKHLHNRLASQSASALMCNISAPHSPASVLSSPSATYYDVDDRIKDNDGSHKYHRFDDQNYPLNITQMTKICQILGQKHEIHDKLKSRLHNRDFSTILARFLLRLLERLESCPVDGFCIDTILLGGGAAAYVLDEHSKPKDTKKSDTTNDNDNEQIEDNGVNIEYKFPPLHYNDVDIMLEIDFEEWDDLVTKWKSHNRVNEQENDENKENIKPVEYGEDEEEAKNELQVTVKQLPFRNPKEHHIAVYAAIRMAFLQCLREFAPKDMQNMDVEDICSAYIDTQKRFLCGDEDTNGGNSDCWAIYSGNHDRGHYLDLVFIHKMKRRYTFSTDSFRIKITKPALQFISESIKQHDRQYKQQQFRKKQRNRSFSYPSLNVLKIKRDALDVKRKQKHVRERQFEQKQRDGFTELEIEKDTDLENDSNDTEDNEETQNIEQTQLLVPRLPRNPQFNGVGVNPYTGAQIPFGAFLKPLPPFNRHVPPPAHAPLNIPGGPPPHYPFTGYQLPNTQSVTLRAVINWCDLAEKLAEKEIAFYAYALCGDYKKARDNLQKRNIGKVANPEKIHGGGFFKYCDLISKQWKRSEKLEKFLWIRLSWDIDINRDYDRKQTSDEYNDDPNDNRYNYMNDLKDIDRTLATYIRRHYKNRAHHVTKFLNSLEIVIKDLRQDDAALEVLRDNLHRLRGKLERHLHEERIHEMNMSTKRNQNQIMNTIRSKSPPIDMIQHTHHTHMTHNGRNVTTHTAIHAQHPPPPGPPLQHTLHPSALTGPPSHAPNGTNPVFPPLPNGAPVMPPGGVLINHHFNLVHHHGKQIQQSMRNMLMPQPHTQPPPNVNTAPAHRPPPMFYPTPNPVNYLRANRAQQPPNTSNVPPPQTPNNTSNNTNNGANANTSGSPPIAMRPLHQNTLQEYQQRYNNNEWVSLYTGHSAAANANASNNRKGNASYHIAPNGQMSKVLPSLVNLNLTKAPPEQTTNIGNIINSYIPYVQETNNEDEDEREDDIEENDSKSEEQQEEAVVEDKEEEEIVKKEEKVEADIVCDNDLIISDAVIHAEKEQMMKVILSPHAAVLLEDEDECEDNEHVVDVNKEENAAKEEEAAVSMKRLQIIQKEEETLPTTPSSMDSDNDPLNMDDIAVDKMMDANLDEVNDEQEDDDENENVEPDAHMIKMLQQLDIESDKENNAINVHNNDKQEENDANIMQQNVTEEGNTNIVSVLPPVNNNNNNNNNTNLSTNITLSTNAEAEGVKQTNFKPPQTQQTLPNTLSQHQIKLVPTASSIPGYPRFFQVNGQTYQFPVANYFVIVPQHNSPLRTHNQRQPVFIPPNMLYTVNNNKDEDNKLEVGATKHNCKQNDSASPPPPSGATQSSFNKGVFIENNLNPTPQNTQLQNSPSLLPIHGHNQLHFHSPNMIHPRPAPPPPPHILHRPYTHLPHQPPFIIQSHLLAQQQQQQQQAAAQQQQQQQHETTAAKESFPPPQKNNSERFRRPENMNDNDLSNNPNPNQNANNNNNNAAANIIINNINNTNNNHRVRAFAHHLPPNHNHAYFYNNQQNNNNNNNQPKNTEALHSNQNRGAYRQRNNNNNNNNTVTDSNNNNINSSNNSNNNNNNNSNNSNNNNYRNNNIHFSYNKRGYNR